MTRQLFSKRPHPYYIYTYDYRRSSAGIRVMHMLCDALIRSGYEAYAYANVLNPDLMTPRLTDEVIKRHRSQGIEPIVVYPEVTNGNPLNANTVVRYLLNQPGFFDGSGKDYGPDDLLFAYTRNLLQAGMPESHVLFMPTSDSRVFCPPDNPSKRVPGKTCYYRGRNRNAQMDEFLPPDAIEITLQWPASWKELADLFQQCEYFYSGVATALAVEAVLCGCVSIILPGELAPINIAQDELQRHGIAWGTEPDEIERARATVPLLREQMLKLQEEFWPALDQFIETTQSLAGKNTGKKNNPLEQWLNARVPTSSKSRLIEQRLSDNRHPSLAIYVRASGGTKALEQTLHSLSALNPLYSAKHAFVLGTAPNDAHDMLPRLQYITATNAAEELNAINELAAESGCDWLLVVDAGDEFTPSGLLITALELLNAPDMRAICADEMIRTGDGNLSALCRPDFNLDLFLSLPSLMARHWLFRRDAFLEAGGFDPAHADSPEFDLLLRMIDAGGLAGLGHVSEPLLVTQPAEVLTRPSEMQALQRHLHNRGYEDARIEADRPGRYRIHYNHAAKPGVSIIIPTKNQLGMLQRCVETLLEKTAYKNYEVLIVDNGSDEADACAWLDGIEAMNSPQLRVLRYPHPFNYSAMNNLAARHARGEYLLLLNNDTAILREDWLDAMLNHAQRPEVGIVGAKLIYPDGHIQHAGVILGLHGPAEHSFIGEKLDALGYMYRLQVDQDYSAVTGACLMVRKSLYEEVGGLDENAFKVSYNDIDLCLKTRQAGYLVAWTPHAMLLHEGSVSPTKVDTAAAEAKAKRLQAEQDAMYAKWLPVIARDPAYNSNLSLNGAAFQVESDIDLTWRPLTWRPLPVTLALPGDQFGCGQYRIIQPTRAMNDFGAADAHCSGRYYTPVELERLSPDCIVLQRQMFEDRIDLQKRMTRFSSAFKVAELDDYLPNLPQKSAHKGTLPKDILKTMRKALTLVDRFVVSTEALAEAYAGLHPDIRVVENHLPLHWWGDVKGERRKGRKPRIGWGGGSGHRGDLELIADVVQALSDEVEWVFFGMCPDKLKPFVHEIVQPVDIEKYPQRLAALNLDLALAPLEDNLFNQCKSNLRLLEYGACGFPVVCSDVRPYQGSLPVTRVKPRFRDWVDAIRMHTHDLDAAAKAGDALRAAVHRDWMLDEKHARFWLSQWMPD